MITKVIIGIVLVVVSVVLVKALIAGRIEFDAGGKGMVADRSERPGAFWTIFSIGVLILACLVWLLIP